MLRRLYAIWQHVSACFGGGSCSQPAASAERMAETARRLLAVIWQIYASGEHLKQIYTNACFPGVCVHVMKTCRKSAIPSRKTARSSETLVGMRIHNVAVARISCRKCHRHSIIVRRLAVNAMQESTYWRSFDEHLHRRFPMFCGALQTSMKNAENRFLQHRYL